MLNWVTIDEAYMNYLRNNFDKRIPKTNYGPDKFKPFFGVLFEVGDLYYVTQVAHAQPRHQMMKNSLDFQKVFIPDKTKLGKDVLAAVINLNYMFPVPKSLVFNLSYSSIDSHRTFISAQEKSKYISLLRSEMAVMNNMDIESKAKKLYALKQSNPEHIISKRCFDFAALEREALNYSAVTV